MAPYPPQSCLYGVALLEDWRAVDKAASREVWVYLLEPLAEVEEHLLYCRVVVGGAGVGCDFCTMFCGISVTCSVFVGDATNDDALCPFDEHCGIGSALDVPFQIVERGGETAPYPLVEESPIALKYATLRHAAEIETNLARKSLYLF